MQASNPLGTLCTLAKMTNLSIPWQDYGGPAAYAARADNQEAIYLRLNDRAVGSILAQNEAEVKLHRLAGEAFAGVAADLDCLDLSMTQQLTKKPLYYFAWDEANGGQEMARYLSELPEEHIVPGSSWEQPFDFDLFAAQAEDVERLDHPVVAFAEGLSASEFFHQVQKRGLSERYPVGLGVVRDVLAHRAAMWSQHLVEVEEAAATLREHQEQEGGSTSRFDKEQLQLRQSFWAPTTVAVARAVGSVANSPWRKRTIHPAEQASSNATTNASDRVSEEQRLLMKPAPPAEGLNEQVERLKKGGAARWLLEEAPSDMQLKRLAGVDTSDRSESLEQLEARLQMGGRELHAMQEFTLEDWKNEQTQGGGWWDRVLRHTHPFDLVVSAYNPLASLCVVANATGLPIAWRDYHRPWKGAGEQGKPAHVPGNESVMLGLADQELALLLSQNSQEAYAVAQLHDKFEALAQQHGCFMPRQVLAAPPTPAVQALRRIESVTEALPPLYYFLHTAKTGGTSVGAYFAKLPAKYVLAGSTALPQPFNFTALREAARDVELDIDTRPHPMIAFGSTRLVDFLRRLLPLGLTDRPIVFLGLARDVLLQRVSHFLEARTYQQHLLYKLAHSSAAPSSNQSSLMMHNWLASREYRSLKWFKQLTPYNELNSHWLEQPVSDMWRELHRNSQSLDRFLASGKAGWQLAPYLRYNGSEIRGMEQESEYPRGRIRMGAIGVESNLPATMCTFARLTGLPLDWEQDIQMKIKPVRPSERVRDWNHGTAELLLKHEPREVAFVSLATSRLEQLAAELGCMPAGPSGLVAASVQPYLQTVPFKPAMSPEAISRHPVPPALYVLPAHTHSGSEVFAHLLASTNISTFLEFAGACSSDTDKATVEGTLSLMRRGCGCLFENADATGTYNQAFQCNGDPEVCAKQMCDADVPPVPDLANASVTPLYAFGNTRCGLKQHDSCRGVAVFPRVDGADLWDVVPPALTAFTPHWQNVSLVQWVRTNAVKHAIAGLKHECKGLRDDQLTLLWIEPTLLLKYAFGRTVDRHNVENLADVGRRRGLRTINVQYEALQQAPADVMRQFLSDAGFEDSSLPNDIALTSATPEDLNEVLVNFEELKQEFEAYPCLLNMLTAVEPAPADACTLEETAGIEAMLDEDLRDAIASSKGRRLIIKSKSISCSESSDAKDLCTRALEMAEATDNLGLIGEDQLVEICSLSVDRDGRGPDDDEIYR